MYSIRKGLHKAFVSGLFSGLFLATMLKIIEQIMHLKVYTPLLNIDYIPYIKITTKRNNIPFGSNLLFLTFLIKNVNHSFSDPFYTLLYDSLFGNHPVALVERETGFAP